jgi:hypothetical protein
MSLVRYITGENDDFISTFFLRAALLMLFMTALHLDGHLRDYLPWPRVLFVRADASGDIGRSSNHS